MAFEITQLSENDVSEVAELEKLTFSDPWTEKDFAGIPGRNLYYAVVCRENAVLCGYAVLLWTGASADLTNICTAKAFRGRGVASALLQEVLSFGENNGVNDFFLEVRESNLPAIRLYEKFSFEKVGVRRSYYHNPTENAFIMRKISTTQTGYNAL